MVPLGNAQYLKKIGIKKVQELDWWQTYTTSDSKIEVHLVPAQHWSARGLTDRNEALWGGFVLKSGSRRAYFAGDTGYGPFFKDIRQRLGAMDLAILPIGAYEPRWFMKDHHMNPEEAVRAHLDLESKLSLGTHFGTFQLTDEGFDEPQQALEEAKAKYKVSKAAFLAPENGETHRLD